MLLGISILEMVVRKTFAVGAIKNCKAIKKIMYILKKSIANLVTMPWS